MSRKLVITLLAVGSMLGAYGKAFSLDLRGSRQNGARLRLAAAAPTQSEDALRSFDLDAGAANVGEVAVGDELTFTLFDDVTLKLTLKKKMPSPLGGDVFLAEVAGYEGIKAAVVLRTAEGLTIDVQDFRNKKYYKVLSTAAGVKVLETEARGSGSSGCDALKRQVSGNSQSSAYEAADGSGSARNASSVSRLQAPASGRGGVYVDILVAYEKNAAAWAKSNGGLNNFAETAVQKMNTALANTGLDSCFRFRLVGVVDVPMASTSLESVLLNAKNGVNGWQTIKTKRDEVGADIVTVLVDTGSAYGTVGLGWSLDTTDFKSFADSAYNACAIRSVAQSHTMTHEVGHNMGCGHSDAQETQPGPQLYDYSAGYYFSAGKNKYHTIMAYGGEGPGGTEVPYFSSPDYMYNGVAVGDSLHNNTLTIKNTYVAVSQWRNEVNTNDIRVVTEESGGYEWTAHEVDDGCVVKSIKPAPAGNVAIPASIGGLDVVGFDEGLFQGNENITSVSIPAAVDELDGYYFYGCKKLASIHVDAANGYFSSVDGIVYDKTLETLVCCPAGVNRLDLPDGLKSIGAYACIGLWNIKEVIVPPGVKDVGDCAFTACNALSTVVISESVTKIGYYAFSFCDRLTTAWVPSRLNSWSLGPNSFYKEGGRPNLHFYSGSLTIIELHFDANGGELEDVKRRLASIGGTVVTTVGTLPVPKREKYKFLGWFTEVDGGTKLTTSTKVTEDTDYYAHWEFDGSATVAVSVADGCGEMGKVTGGNAMFKAGAKVSLKATANNGYVFVGWKYAGNGEGGTGNGDTLLSQSASFSYVATGEPVEIVAVFASAEDDAASLIVNVTNVVTTADGTITLDLSGCVESLSPPKLAVSGLPSGLKYDSKTMKISGKVAKPGVYTVKVTATNASATGKNAVVEEFTIEVMFPTLSIETAAWGDASATNGCKVVGGGKYPYGKKITLKATPGKGCVFAGWDETGNGEQGTGNGIVSQAAIWSIVMPSNDVTHVAVFATGAEDIASLKVTVTNATTAADGTYELDLGKCVESITMPKFAVTGLPQGLKYDAKTMKIAGKATKPGVYTVKVAATNTSVKKATKDSTGEFTLTVPNFKCSALPKLEPGTDAYGSVLCGVVFDDSRIDCTPADTGWTVKVAGLPSGLKFDAKAGKITGVPTAKPGPYTVTFTASKKGEANQVATITLNVEAMPAEIVGSYIGMAGGFEDDADDDTWRAFGMVTLTVAANGKLSAKATLPSGTISFSTNGWDSESNGVYRVEMSTKAGDRLSLELDGNRDWKGARIDTPDSVLTTAKGAVYLVAAWRNEHGKTGNIAADETASDFIAKIIALKKLCFKVTGDAETGYTCDEVPTTDKTANLTLTFDAKGNVKYSGKIGGKTISGTSALNVDGDSYYTIGDLVVPFSKTEALYLALGFDREDNEPVPGLDVFHVTDRGQW